MVTGRKRKILDLSPSNGGDTGQSTSLLSSPSQQSATGKHEEEEERRASDDDTRRNNNHLPSASSSQALSPEDQGHRHGNFHQYYRFHPPTERTQFLWSVDHHEGSVLDAVLKAWWTDASNPPDQAGGNDSGATTNIGKQLSHANRIFSFVDLGCNEGDLTMAVAQLLSRRWHDLSQKHTTCSSQNTPASNAQPSSVTAGSLSLCVVGVDIDPVLINRANEKWTTLTSADSHLDKKEKDNDGASPVTTTTFLQADLLELSDLSAVHASPSVPQQPQWSADFTTLFSTTMWLHIHGGDEGLARVLRWICTWTRFGIVIEPQPSSCYRQAMVRLRRLGRPALPDVSPERLTWRKDLDRHIDQIMLENNFVLMTFTNVDSNDHQKINNKTSWNRALRFYLRKMPSMSSTENG